MECATFDRPSRVRKSKQKWLHNDLLVVMHVQEARHGRLRIGMSGADLLAAEDAGPLEGLHVGGYAGEGVGLVMKPKGRESKWGHGLTSSSCTRLTADLG